MDTEDGDPLEDEPEKASKRGGGGIAGPVGKEEVEDIPVKTKKDEAPRRTNKPRGSSVQPQYGRRRMKYYPLSKGDIRFLTVSNALTSICFAVAAACATFSLDVERDFAIASNVPPAAVAKWGGYEVAAGILAFVLFIVGAGFWIWRELALRAIEEETQFDD